MKWHLPIFEKSDHIKQMIQLTVITLSGDLWYEFGN